MRILRVAQTVYPEVAGGGAYHVHALSRDQAARGHDVTVLTVRQEPGAPHVEERDGYTVVRFDPTVELLGNQLSAGLARYLRHRGDVDVVHAHSHLYVSTNLAALRRRLDDVPLAVTNHGLYSQTAPEWFVDLYLRTVGAWTYQQADLAFCYTDVDAERLRSLGVETPIEVVPNGVDTERFSPEGPESERVDADGPAVLFVGRLVDGKRPQDAVAAMDRVRDSLPEATLYLAGDGPLRSDLERTVGGDRAVGDDRSEERDGDVDRAASSAVEFLGHVPYDEMPDLYRAADLLVLPSRAEGMPRTVLEARAAGTPVVTTDLEHLAAVDGPGVRTVPVGDVDRLAAAIRAELAAAGVVSAQAGAAVGGAAAEHAATDGAAAAGAAPDGGATTPSGADREGVDSATFDLDWASTVRETTDALRRLVDAADDG